MCMLCLSVCPFIHSSFHPTIHSFVHWFLKLALLTHESDIPDTLHQELGIQQCETAKCLPPKSLLPCGSETRNNKQDITQTVLRALDEWESTTWRGQAGWDRSCCRSQGNLRRALWGGDVWAETFKRRRWCPCVQLEGEVFQEEEAILGGVCEGQLRATGAGALECPFQKPGG